MNYQVETVEEAKENVTMDERPVGGRIKIYVLNT